MAITSGVVGVFTVTRGQSFAGHALADVATTGGSGAFLIGLNQFWGFLVFGIGTAAFLEIIGVQRRRGRDVATGVVLGAALGLAALFLYLGSATTSTTGASFTILFGSIFVIAAVDRPRPDRVGPDRAGVVVVLSRVLLLSSLSPDIAAARGVPVRAVGRRLPDRPGGVGLAVRRRHRRGAQHRAADRPGRDGAARGAGDRSGRWPRPR